MKIGIVCYPSVGGSGILATQLGLALAQAGHQVHFVCSERPVRLKNQDSEHIFFHQVEMGDYAVFQGTDYSLPLAVKIAEVCRDYSLEVLHVHYAIPHAVAALLALDMLKDPKPRLVTTLHGTDITLLGPDPAYRCLIEHAIKESDAVTAVSQSLRKQTYALFPDCQGQIQVISNFSNVGQSLVDRDQFRANLGVGPEQILILHMSNLRAVKRVDLLLQAVAQSAHRERLVLLFLAGASFEPHRPLVEQLGLDEKVLVRSATSVEDYVKACDLGLYPSDKESFGLAILETMLGQRPVIASTAGGIPEVLGEDGLLFECGDLQGLVSHLDRLVDDAGLRQDLGQRGADRARRLFTIERALEGYLKVYGS